MTAALVAILLFATACAAEDSIRGIEEPSGVAHDGNRLLIVGDEPPGTWFAFPSEGEGTGRIPLHPERLRKHVISAGKYAMDLEAIDILADGRIVVLSEFLRALLDEDGVVASYPDHVAEFGGRGLEGIAVRDLGGGRSRVAVLWEGGYPHADLMPAALRGAADRAMLPVVLVHDLERGASERRIRGRDVVHECQLVVPLPPGVEPWAQRFRAPDLVWHEVNGEAGFIVLISSACGARPDAASEAVCPKTDAKGRPLRYCYRWLQRFTADGAPFGEPHDLEHVFPEGLRHENWEGMSWFVPGESLVFVYDEKLKKQPVIPQEAFVMPLPEGW